MKKWFHTKQNGNKRSSSAGGLYTSTAGAVTSLILMLTYCAMFGANVHAEPSALNLSISESNVGIDISSLGVDGAFAESNSSTISVSTNNITGYVLKIAASNTTANAHKKLSMDSEHYLSSISSAIVKSTFSATTVAGRDYNNMWGYLPSQYYDSANDNFIENTGDNPYFFPAPDGTGDILGKTNAANTEENNSLVPDIYTIGFGVRIDASAKIGNYSNTYIIQLIAEAVPYSIIYKDNIVSNMPANVTGTADSSTSVTVSGTTPTRDGYIFNGWCKVQPTINSDGADTCPSGQSIAAGGNLPISGDSANEFTLYAMWKDNYSINNVSTMQEFNTMSVDKKGKIISSMTLEQIYTLKDDRDQQDYTVAKLKDGNVWMTRNLNLAGGTVITCNTSDCDNYYVIPTTQGWQSGGRLPASSTNGFSAANYSYVYNSNSTECSSASGCYSYYSWDAATLGSGRNISVNNTDAPYSICPKGWRLPTSRSAAEDNSNSDFGQIVTAYSMNADTTGSFYDNAGLNTVPDFLFAGAYSNDSFYSGGVYGFYWSSTSLGNNSTSHYLSFGSNFVRPEDGDARKYGLPIRCLLR